MLKIIFNHSLPAPYVGGVEASNDYFVDITRFPRSPPYKARPMEALVMPDPELLLRFLTLTLSAKGLVALLLAFPVALILAAIAWRIVRG